MVSWTVLKMFHNILPSESHEMLQVIENTICKRYQREWIDYFLSSAIMLPANARRLGFFKYFSSLFLDATFSI